MQRTTVVPWPWATSTTHTPVACEVCEELPVVGGLIECRCLCLGELRHGECGGAVLVCARWEGSGAVSGDKESLHKAVVPVYIHVCDCVCIRVWLCVYICVYVYMCICIYVCIYVCMCTCICACVPWADGWKERLIYRQNKKRKSKLTWLVAPVIGDVTRKSKGQ